MKVFIIDDSIVVSKRLKSMLEGIENLDIVGDAQNAVEALEKIKTNKPDLVISDLRMPGGSGFEVLDKLKKEFPSIVVIILTNYPEPHYEKKCIELGANYFLDKSNDFEKVVEIITQMMKSES